MKYFKAYVYEYLQKQSYKTNHTNPSVSLSTLIQIMVTMSCRENLTILSGKYKKLVKIKIFIQSVEIKGG